MNRWAKAGVLDRLFAELQREQLIRIKIEAVSLDSTIVKVHPDGTGALKKTAIGKCRAGWSTKVHMVAASARCAIGSHCPQDRPATLRRDERCCVRFPNCPCPATC
jgi:hypothetical protein